MSVHPPLGEARLGPRAWKVVGPAGSPAQRELAARALLPLPGPEPWLALYELWAAGEEPLAALAGRTAAELPATPVLAALADPRLPAPALDFMARRRLTRPEELAVLVRHPQVDDAALVLLARCGPPGVCESLALNQRRWLARPAVVAALARNPRCPAATLHAALELGAREGGPALARLRRDWLAGHVLADTQDAQAALVARALRSRAGEDLGAAPPLADAVADDPPPAPEPAPPAADRARGTPVQVDMVLDPRTPLPLAMSLLSRLRPPDLRRVAQARRLPPALVAAARRRLTPG